MRPSNKLIFVIFLISFLVVFNNCGSESQEQIGDLSWDTNVEPTSWHNLLNSKSYSGRIAVMFQDGTDVRLRAGDPDGPFVSMSKGVDLKGINQRFSADTTDVMDVVPTFRSGIIDVSRIRRGVESVSEDQIEEARINAAEKGVELTDWNLYYTIEVFDSDEAEKLIAELVVDPSVRWVNPLSKIEPQGGDDTTPDLSGEQTYLKPNESDGGLNVIAGWDAGATGTGVVVVDIEINWNFDHENLGMIASDDLIYDYPAEGYTNPLYVQHGTAVAGVVAGLGDSEGFGIKGVVPNSSLKLMRAATVDSVTDSMVKLVAGVFSNEVNSKVNVKQGDIIIIPCGSHGPTTPQDVNCMLSYEPEMLPGTGCVPAEVALPMFTAIENAVNAGLVVIEGAGNGTVDLSSSAAKWTDCGSDPCPDLSEDSTGAIMVAASQGANHQRFPLSNWGARVDLYAWGEGVVTTGYGSHPQTPDPNDPNRWYTASFGATSAAAAMIGGVAAQVQSYIKKIFNHNGAYLNSQQMKSLLIASGVPQSDSVDQYIGKQPDVGVAIQMISSWQIPDADMINISPVSKNVVSGIRYDMDGDRKADLISFSIDNKWYVDLSKNGFGSWDLILNVPAFSECQDNPWDCMLFPVVGDYNSNGRADLALYDSVHGKWYIKYTTEELLTSQQNSTIEWDRVIDYSTDLNWKEYSRPFVDDVDGDKFVDIEIVTPDGYWIRDFGGFDGVKLVNGSVVYLDKFGSFNRIDKFLTDTQLQEAPGWSWLPASSGGIKYLFFKKPLPLLVSDIYVYDVYYAYINTYGVLKQVKVQGSVSEFGANDSYFFTGGYHSNDSHYEYSFKKPNGDWICLDYANDVKFDPMTPPVGGFGDILCYPIPADYDGDGKDDLAVQCGNTWKIAYSSDPSAQLTEYQLGEASDPLPAYVYAGGIRYQDQLDLFNHYKTDLQCGDSLCDSNSTIYDVNPPIGPYFAQCVNYWAPDANNCWDK